MQLLTILCLVASLLPPSPQHPPQVSYRPWIPSERPIRFGAGPKECRCYADGILLEGPTADFRNMDSCILQLPRIRAVLVKRLTLPHRYKAVRISTTGTDTCLFRAYPDRIVEVDSLFTEDPVDGSFQLQIVRYFALEELKP